MNDALFIDLVKEEKETLNRFKEMTDKDREDFLKKVESRKKKGQPEGEFKAKFKPGGPQDYIDL